MHPEDNQTFSLRHVDPTAYDGVWAIIDDGCNSCSRSKAWRRNAEAKMKVLGLHTCSLHKKATTFNGTRRNTKNGKRRFPWAILMLYPRPGWSHVPLSDGLLSLVQSVRARSFLIFSFSVEGLGRQWMSRTPRPTLTSSDPDEYDGHNIRNLMLELLYHAACWRIYGGVT